MPTTNRALPILSALLTVTAFACDVGNDGSNGARAGRGEVEGDSDTDDNSADTDDDDAASDDGGGTGDDCVPSSSAPNGSCDGTSGGGSDDGDHGSSGGDDDDDGEADLPYNMNLQLGDSFKLSDAFLEEGPLPAAILSVEMEGGDWRLTELQTDTEYVVTQEDCDHEGNHGTGRDRIILSWQNADGSEDSDHMTIRYCD